MGYETKVVANPRPKPKSTAAVEKGAKAPLPMAPVPKDGPEFFVAAMQRARELKRPVVIDFWAKWCAPCKKLKKLTMEHTDVAKVLGSMEVIYVDLDKHPSLAKAYGVKSIPDVFFVDAEGFVVDRLRKFEAKAPFLKRLAKISGKPARGDRKK